MLRSRGHSPTNGYLLNVSHALVFVEKKKILIMQQSNSKKHFEEEWNKRVNDQARRRKQKLEQNKIIIKMKY